MISDKYLFRESEKALDKIERLASCYEFKTKEVLQIRLLAEEIISVISPTLKLSDGRCWICTDKESFAVTIDCDAGISGLDGNTKKQLMKMGRDDKNKGIFGMIGKIFEYLSMPDANYSTMMGQPMIYSHSYGIDAGLSSYYWNPEFESSLQVPKPATSVKEKDEHDLEISIIEGYADDIRVSLQKNKTGLRLEITVVKNFAPGQVSGIEF